MLSLVEYPSWLLIHCTPQPYNRIRGIRGKVKQDVSAFVQAMFGIKHGSVNEAKKLLRHQSYIYVVSKANTCLGYKTLYTHACCFAGLWKAWFSASLPSSSHLCCCSQGIFWKINICWFCTWWPVHVIHARPSTGTWINWWDGCTCVNCSEFICCSFLFGLLIVITVYLFRYMLSFKTLLSLGWLKIHRTSQVLLLKMSTPHTLTFLQLHARKIH